MFLNGKCQIEKWLFFSKSNINIVLRGSRWSTASGVSIVWLVGGCGWLSNWCRKVSLVRLQTMGDIEVKGLVLLLKELLSLLLLKPRLIDKALLLLKPRLIDKALLLLKPRLIDKALLLLKPRLIDKALLLLKPRLIDKALLLFKPRLIDKANPHILDLTVFCSLASQTWTCG